MANLKVGGDRKSKNQSLNFDSDPKPVTLESAAKTMNLSRATAAAAKTVLKDGGPGKNQDREQYPDSIRVTFQRIRRGQTQNLSHARGQCETQLLGILE
jgi:hypothetical protein